MDKNRIVLHGVNIYSEFFLKWLDEIIPFHYYCLKGISLSKNFEIKWILGVCDDDNVENYVLVLSKDKKDKRDLSNIEFSDLRNKNIVRSIILCYNLDKKIRCWMKSKDEIGSSQPIKTDVDLNNEIGIKSIIYLYYDNNEYYLIYDDRNKIIKKIINCVSEDYYPIEHVIEAKHKAIIKFFKEGYDKTEKVISIVDIALDLGINECEFYLSIYPFTIAGKSSGETHYLLAEIPNISSDSKKMKENKKERLVKKLSSCLNR